MLPPTCSRKQGGRPLQGDGAGPATNRVSPVVRLVPAGTVRGIAMSVDPYAGAQLEKPRFSAGTTNEAV